MAKPNPVFARYLLVLFLCAHSVHAQPYFSRIRGDFGIEANGITPRGGVTAEAAFGYAKRSFWLVQGGLGAINRPDFRTPTLSAALTHCLILNPYKRNACNPRPGHYLVEGYLEAGAGAFLVDRYDNGMFYRPGYQRLLTPSGLAGIRFHVVTPKWIYMLKVRYTPPLLPNAFASRAGVGIGLGWR